MTSVSTDKGEFPFFTTSEDHEELRQAVRNVAEDKIAPHAAEADETSTFPQASYDALVASDFHAPHIAEEYDGVGADALASLHRDRGDRPGVCLILPDPGREQAGHDAVDTFGIR